MPLVKINSGFLPVIMIQRSMFRYHRIGGDVCNLRRQEFYLRLAFKSYWLPLDEGEEYLPGFAVFSLHNQFGWLFFVSFSLTTFHSFAAGRYGFSLISYFGFDKHFYLHLCFITTLIRFYQTFQSFNGITSAISAVISRTPWLLMLKWQ